MYSRLNSPFLWIIAFFILLFVYTKLVGPISFSVNSTTTKSDTFNVTGEGKATVQPDLASVTVGIQANGSTVKAVQEQINSVISKVSEAIKKLGVEQKDIQTTNYNVNPTYDFTGGNQKITGYAASTNLKIKVKDIDKMNNVIDTATQNGTNQVGAVTFELEDKSKAENEAREKAVADAKKKAQDAAKIAGFKLGRIVNYSESSGGFPPTIMMRAREVPEVSGTPTQVEPGSTDLSITVTLSYEIQ